MEQSKLESKIETILNIFSGFFISVFMWAMIVAPLIKLNVLSIDNTYIITGIFTVTSLLRSYFWRRFFATGIHIVVHKWLNSFGRLTGW